MSPPPGTTGKADGADEKDGPPNQATRRRLSRLYAVQALYQMDLAHTDLNDVIAEFGTDHLNDREEKAIEPESAQPESASNIPAYDYDQSFFKSLVRGVVARQTEIDPMIDHQLADGWRLARIDSTLRAILRSSAYELLGRKDVPARVVINEYLSIAHAFFDGDEPAVVNGVLDGIAHQLRPDEFDKIADT